MKRYLTFLCLCIISVCTQAQETALNYLQTRTMLTEQGDTYIEQVRYYDGLGRPFQKMTRNYPFAETDSCLLTVQGYDQTGRPDIQYLPMPRKEKYLDVPNFSLSSQFYYKDSRPYISTEYEKSPLNRIIKMTKPGEDWNGHSKTIVYGTNADAGNWCCAYYYIDAAGKLARNGNYQAGLLEATEETDEDGHVSYTFTNMQGKTILTREMDGTVSHDTYYVYDDYGNLFYVLPPMINDDITSQNLDKYAYRYRYDHRNRLVEKKLPGTDPVTYAYDAADHLTLMQDGNMKKKGKYRLYLYDKHNRLAVQAIADQSLITGIKDLDKRVISCFYSNLPIDLENIMMKTAIQFELCQELVGTGYHVNLNGTLTPIEHNMLYEIINYYDNYDFKHKVDGFKNIPDLEYPTLSGTLTGRIVSRMSEPDRHRYELYAYNRKRKLVSTLLHDSLSYNRKTDYTYSFTGKPLTQTSVYFTGTFGTPAEKVLLTETYTYLYNKKNLLASVKHRMNNGPEVQLLTYTYDVTERIIANTFHNISNPDFRIEYKYNIQNWLTAISGTKFSQNLYYNTGNGTPCYNGNISSMTWKAGNETTLRGYKFTYDGLDRMLDAVYGESTSISSNANRFTEKVTGYDKNGNILALQRYGQTGTSTYGLIDNLTFTLNGNQLNRVDDAVTASAYNNGFEFKDAVKQADEYAYDANGNLTKDLNKGISNISYNCLNLPSVVTFSDGSTITYTYAADGTKLRTVHTIGSTTTTTDYCGNVIYENGVQKLLLTEAGYVTLADSKYHYYLQDHQGNNRVVIDQSGTVKEVNHYYPFGGVFASTSSVQPYKYNGKELDTKKGLNWYDYGARHYDAAIGRFATVDPMAEKYYSWSPYTYCLDNPIKYVDNNGETPRIYVETKGFGHVFVTTGSGQNTTVYTYGRYGDINWNKSSSASSARNGEGVLIIMKGKEALEYIKNEITKMEARVYEVLSGNDEKVDKHFKNLFDSSDKKPSTKSYRNAENARVVDEYDLLDNNCTTKSLEAISIGTNGEFDIESISPSNLDTQLYYENKKDDSRIRKITYDELYEEYFK